MKPLKIAIGVGGRFHADRMASALLELGQDPSVYTSFPASKFPNIPSHKIVSTIYPEILFRLLRSVGGNQTASDLKMKQFGKALAKKVSRDAYDVFLGWSSFSKEVLQKKLTPRQILMRDSSHISFQMDLLEEEYKSLGLQFSRDRVAETRELEEYELADEIFVLSQFALKSFRDRGIPASKLKVLRLGVDTSLFFSDEKKAESPKKPLKVIYFGAVSLRKGVHYFLEASKKFQPKEVTFHCVGDVDSQLKKRVSQTTEVLFYPAMSQKKLANFIREMDVFVFPTLEDGFGQTLIQAMASGLVPIFTPNSGASELVSPEQGIQIPIRSSEALAQAIHELLHQPEKRIEMGRKAIQRAQEIHWGVYRDRLSELFLNT